MSTVALGGLGRYAELRARYRSFMEQHLYPNEQALAGEDEAADELVAELRRRARAEGLWAPHLPPEAGGSGQGFLAYAALNEEIGRVFVAQLVFNCQAPDAGNGEILHLFGSDEQKRRFLEPLVAGGVRSFFSMTEPEVSGADPTGLRTSARLDGDSWVIDGRKWFSTAAEGAGFGIVMAVTDPDAEPHRRTSQIIVLADTPGVEIEAVPVLGHRGRGWSTHCEVRYRSVRVPAENLLGERGGGFAIAQARLGPGRIHHVMRWLGQMQRAFELLCERALERRAFGGPLADKQTVQNWIAESAAEIHACRLLTYDAADPSATPERISATCSPPTASPAVLRARSAPRRSRPPPASRAVPSSPPATRGAAGATRSRWRGSRRWRCSRRPCSARRSTVASSAAS